MSPNPRSDSIDFQVTVGERKNAQKAVAKAKASTIEVSLRHLEGSRTEEMEEAMSRVMAKESATEAANLEDQTLFSK